MKPEKAFEIIEEYKTKVEAVRTTQVMTLTLADMHVRRSPKHQNQFTRLHPAKPEKHHNHTTATRHATALAAEQIKQASCLD